MLEYVLLVLLGCFTLAGLPIIRKVYFKPWKKDKWLSKSGTILKYDKLEHFILAFILFWLWNFLPIEAWFAVVISWWIGFVWECKDGLWAYDKINIEGFSWKDLIANTFGILLGYLTHLIRSF